MLPLAALISVALWAPFNSASSVGWHELRTMKLTWKEWASWCTKLWKSPWGAGPKLKYATTAAITCRSLLSLFWVATSSSSFLIMFCLRKLSNSISAVVIILTWFVAILKRKTSRGHVIMWYPRGGRNAGQSQQNSDIVLLCICFLSN